MRPLLDVRSYLDTRGGVIMMIISALFTLGAEALAGLLQPKVIPDAPVSMYGTVIVGSLPLTVVLPVLAVLVIASDWSNQSIQTTFLHRPQRGAVLGSKMLATLILSAILLAIALAGAFALTALGGVLSPHGSDFSQLGDTLLPTLCQLAASLAFGMAMACLLQNTALGLIAAIAVPFVVATISTLAMGGGDVIQHLVDLVDLSTASTDLARGDLTLWGAGAFVIMLVLPIIGGAVRWHRREIA